MVAQAHSLTVTETDVEKAAHFPAHYAAVKGFPEQNDAIGPGSQVRDLHGDTSRYEILPEGSMTPTGFEQPTKSPAKPQISPKGGADCGAVGGDAAEMTDPALDEVIRVWPKLPPELHVAIVTIARSASGQVSAAARKSRTDGDLRRTT